VSDGCLVLVAPVSSDVFVWTADSPLHTHNWRMGKLRARRCSLEPRRTLRDTWTNFLSCVKQQNFRKQNLARENQVRDDGEVTQVCLMRAHRGVVPPLRVKNPQMKSARVHCAVDNNKRQSYNLKPVYNNVGRYRIRTVYVCTGIIML